MKKSLCKIIGMFERIYNVLVIYLCSLDDYYWRLSYKFYGLIDMFAAQTDTFDLSKG